MEFTSGVLVSPDADEPSPAADHPMVAMFIVTRPVTSTRPSALWCEQISNLHDLEVILSTLSNPSLDGKVFKYDARS